MVNRVRSFRGYKTHGKGTKKNRRGGGSRGGRGRSGGDKHHFQLYGVLYGKHGFHRPNTRRARALSLRDLEEMAHRWAAEGRATREDDAIALDLDALGVAKVVGGWTPRTKLILKGGAVTEGAKEAVLGAGGRVVPAPGS